MLLVWGVAVLLLLVAVVACVLVAHTRHARRRAVRDFGSAYQPHSADPRGRWQVSRLGPDLVEPTAYLLNTDHDEPSADRGRRGGVS